MINDAQEQRNFQSLVACHRRELIDLWRNSVDIFAVLEPLLKAHGDEIVAGFYRRLRENAQAAAFLTTDLVNQRLRQGVARWLAYTFHGAHAQTVEEFLEYQARLGRMHADMDIPLNLFLLGLRVLKSELRHWVEKLPPAHHKAAILYIDDLLDLVLAIATESYSEGHTEMVADLQKMRMSIPPENLQLVCEQMRNKLLRWYAEQLAALHQEAFDGDRTCAFVSLRDSEIGLWLEHKASLLFPESESLTRLTALCREIDTLFQKIQRDSLPAAGLMGELDRRLRQADLLLAEMGREVAELEGRTDPLTRLFNRRHLGTVLSFGSRQARKGEQQYAIILIDIDHFKRINDTYGHDVGDQILKWFADLLTENVRSSDFVFRYGGEEFLLLLPSVQAQTAELVAEKLRRTVAETPVTLPDGKKIQLTISCGIAMSAGEWNYERVIKRADEALYRAKERGRNRCELSRSS